jgi:hypothetical protein
LWALTIRQVVARNTVQQDALTREFRLAYLELLSMNDCFIIERIKKSRRVGMLDESQLPDFVATAITLSLKRKPRSQPKLMLCHVTRGLPGRPP